MPPEELAELHRKELGLLPDGTAATPPADDDLLTFDCRRCGQPLRPPLTWRAVRALDAGQLYQLHVAMLRAGW